jgi:TonB-linked SusC/RagA family outer membrane protein
VYPLSGAFVNPLSDEQPNTYANEAKQMQILANVYVELKPLTGLTFRTNLGTNFGYSRNGLFSSSTSIDRNGSANLSSYTSSNNTFINWDNVATYQTTIKDHSITVTALSSYIQNISDNVAAQGQGQLIPDQLFYALGNASANLAINSGYEKWNVLSFAGRLNYGYKGKYLLTLTHRADGASRLSEGNKWASFPSAAVAWRIVDENFMQGAERLSDLKLRLSYGVAGNSAIPPYGTQSSLTRIAFAYGETGAQGFTFSPFIGNPGLGWELSKTGNIGLDIGFFNNKLTAALDVYDTRTSDLLLPRGLPPTTGVQQVYQNIGKTRNRGIEISVNSTNVSSKDFSWTTTATFTSNKEQIISLVTDGVDDIGNGWFVGHPIQVFYDYEKLGIWQTAEATDATAFGQKPGDIKVRDLNNDKKIDATNDRRVLGGNNRPRWFGGLSNSVSYKGFDLNVYLFARWGQMINPDFLRRYHTQAQENSGTIINYWTPENPSNDYPRPNANLSLATMLYTSTIGYVDGSYLRIRNLSLGYTFPKFKTSFVESLRIYATGTNLVTWTKSAKLKEYDPERGGGESFPMTKNYVFGVNVGF